MKKIVALILSTFLLPIYAFAKVAPGDFYEAVSSKDKVLIVKFRDVEAFQLETSKKITVALRLMKEGQKKFNDFPCHQTFTPIGEYLSHWVIVKRMQPANYAYYAVAVNRETGMVQDVLLERKVTIKNVKTAKKPNEAPKKYGVKIGYGMDVASEQIQHLITGAYSKNFNGKLISELTLKGGFLNYDDLFDSGIAYLAEARGLNYVSLSAFTGSKWNWRGTIAKLQYPSINKPILEVGGLYSQRDGIWNNKYGGYAKLYFGPISAMFVGTQKDQNLNIALDAERTQFKTVNRFVVEDELFLSLRVGVATFGYMYALSMPQKIIFRFNGKDYPYPEPTAISAHLIQIGFDQQFGRVATGINIWTVPAASALLNITGTLQIGRLGTAISYQTISKEWLFQSTFNF